MTKNTTFVSEKLLLALSGCAFLFLIVPAWMQGFAWTAVSAGILCLTVWRLPLNGQRIRQLMQHPPALAVSLALSLGFGCNFHNNWTDSRYVARIAKILGVGTEPFLLAVTAVVVVLTLPAVTCALAWFFGAAKSAYRKAASVPAQSGIPMGKAVWILFAVYALGISGILRADFLYRDDFGRAFFGYKQWDYFARYLSTALATLVHGGDYLVDAAPMPQLLAVLILAVSGIAMLYVIYGRTRFTVWELAALVPLGLNPYFLECLSYRFDAPYMAVSVLAAVLPLLFRNQRTIAYIFASMLGILAVCTSYQAATGIFPILVIFLMLRMWNEENALQEIFLFCGKSVAGYVLGILFFMLVLMRPADAGYVSNSLPAAGDMLGNTVDNLLQYYRYVDRDFSPLWKIAAVLAAAAFLLSAVSRSRRKKPAALAAGIAALVLMGLLCFGIYPVLAEPVFAPRAMYGFGVLITVFGIAAAEEEKKLLRKLPVLALCWLFVVFSFTYGNALNAQKEYTDFRIQLVIRDLNEMEIFRGEEPVTVQTSGRIGNAPVLANMPQDGTILTRLLPKTFGGRDDLGNYGFYYYYGLKNVKWDMTEDLRELDLPIVRETMYHTIRSDGTNVLIELK